MWNAIFGSGRAKALERVRRLLVTPVVVDVADPTLLGQARMVIAATGRAMLRTDQAESLFGVDGAAMLHRVTGADEEGLVGGGSLGIAERIGSLDRLTIAVVGAQGGVGATMLAARLARTVAASVAGDGEPVCLVDADEFSVGLDLVCGWEQVLGHRLGGRYSLSDCGNASGQNGTDQGAGTMWPNVPGTENFYFASQAPSRGGDGGSPGWDEVDQDLERVLGPAHDRASQVTVVDCGRWIPAEDSGLAADLFVVVGAPTLAGAFALARVCEQLEALDVPTVAVFRGPRDGSPVPTPLQQMLGERSLVVWPHDEQVEREAREGVEGATTATDCQLAEQILRHRPGADMPEVVDSKQVVAP